jgi:1-deoxy-D-xylulose-5-phosphate reductoisomerase
MMKQIVLLGSTGSIGVQTLEVCRLHNIRVKALSAHSNIELLQKQQREFNVQHVCLSSVAPDSLCSLAAIPNCIVVNAIVGSAGLKPTLAAIRAGNSVALANKETLVAGGEIVMDLSRQHNAPIIPVDSEHSAIYQCLVGHSNSDISKIILTASGGPFLGYSKEQLRSVTREQTLCNPNWSMGDKITVDSATMMNKGLELIEAVHLFDIDESKIEVVVHPQSIVHSAVEFIDGSVIAQMAVPDMRLPIQYALCGSCRRVPSPVKRLSLTELGALTFLQPDGDTFPALAFARNALRIGGTAPCALNAANEEAVKLFLDGEIAFYEITTVIAQAFTKTEKTHEVSLSSIEETEKLVREAIRLS